MYHPDIADIEPIVRAAGEAIMAIYRHGFTVEYKSDDSPLTKADQCAHKVIVQALEKLTPTLPVLSEESGPDVMAARHQWSHYWLVDPLDGTKEFVSRNGEFTVNIALIEHGRSVWGIVYAPVLDKLWYGGKAQGAWRIVDGQREMIQVRPHLPGTAWRVVGSRSHLSSETRDFLVPLGDIEWLSMGSSLKFCVIAEGEAELYPRLAPTCEWDTAAAQAVLEGAGGRVTQLDGTPLTYNKPDILNPWFIASAES
ncbi:3'(2'),5'-bisphosphate nucleotidase CysQ [Aeromonas cavernicola]|uniref:3'(2'),5'-bisphosphate nucleotidase CysQ n=1 Tax=Aeromonas cavernicola TaxID=1006623 RepID=A0A2H9U5T7_9GAMM|nr:3'(2'),5'-bisphosphate nucleotidase CysQ [Aeromonas cavernicola]PJG59381.1 3'(2'),5'-bisphosphate nucleotidase [Aeromonas cavernicola]